ncbi:C39 family peptidase [Methanococcoides burtonii]|uniref:Peptidase C39-like domain-containing protein n=1 Tax=Methanococcoides burtonii (strain DSM 6242 / NBRC 107633 / OCM 468 / ACE-M) TaxID=259564 RepID=Q12WY2_METBU|nr:C39 family peptidase [Methanococcoides burtonii]ABE52044.1 Hypothetical protein Mbur_1118 [Methanococcoides burtonii DSM 6242]
MQKSKTTTVIAIMLLILVAFVPMVSAQEETLPDSSSNKQVTIELNQKDGVLIIPTEDKKITDLSTTATTEKPAVAFLSGTIDENNLVVLNGVITLDGKAQKVQLSGEATQVFIGWDVPEGAKPIYSTVGDEKIGFATITRYEGATKKYATHIEVQDESDKFSFHGEFFKDGHGGLVGTMIIDGKECQIGLLGNSISLYENVSPSSSTKSAYIDVPHRSQWELFWDLHGYAAASTACGDTVAAMLEEYYTGTSPDIWDIYLIYGSMGASEAEDYLQDQSINADKRSHTGSLSYVIDCAQYYIDTGRPFYLIEESNSGELHAVVLRGYSDAYDYFVLNDPNTLSGTEQMYWYDSDDPSFNFEENVYENIGGEDSYSNGMVIVV